MEFYIIIVILFSIFLIHFENNIIIVNGQKQPVISDSSLDYLDYSPQDVIVYRDRYMVAKSEATTNEALASETNWNEVLPHHGDELVGINGIPVAPPDFAAAIQTLYKLGIDSKLQSNEMIVPVLDSLRKGATIVTPMLRTPTDLKLDLPGRGGGAGGGAHNPTSNGEKIRSYIKIEKIDHVDSYTFRPYFSHRDYLQEKAMEWGDSSYQNALNITSPSTTTTTTSSMTPQTCQSNKDHNINNKKLKDEADLYYKKKIQEADKKAKEIVAEAIGKAGTMKNNNNNNNNNNNINTNNNNKPAVESIASVKKKLEEQRMAKEVAKQQKEALLEVTVLVENANKQAKQILEDATKEATAAAATMMKEMEMEMEKEKEKKNAKDKENDSLSLKLLNDEIKNLKDSLKEKEKDINDLQQRLKDNNNKKEQNQKNQKEVLSEEEKTILKNEFLLSLETTKQEMIEKASKEANDMLLTAQKEIDEMKYLASLSDAERGAMENEKISIQLQKEREAEEEKRRLEEEEEWNRKQEENRRKAELNEQRQKEEQARLKAQENAKLSRMGMSAEEARLHAQAEEEKRVADTIKEREEAARAALKLKNGEATMYKATFPTRMSFGMSFIMDAKTPIIEKVDHGSEASKRSIAAGHQLVSVNDVDVSEKSPRDTFVVIQNAEYPLTLLLYAPGKEDPKKAKKEEVEKTDIGPVVLSLTSPEMFKGDVRITMADWGASFSCPPIDTGSYRFLVNTEPCTPSIDLQKLNPEGEPFILIFLRGQCTFDIKAQIGINLGASMVAIANNKDGHEVIEMPATKSTKVSSVPVFMIPKIIYDSIHGLLSIGTKGANVYGYIAPKDTCYVAPLPIDEAFEKKKNRNRGEEDKGGKLSIIGTEIEESFNFFQSKFGGDFPMEPHRIIHANPIDGCSKDKYQSAIRGHYVLVHRGKCGFTEKVLAAQKLGAAGVIIVNTDQNIMRMMGDPEIAKDIEIASAMVTPKVGEMLRKKDVYGNFILEDFMLDYEEA